MEKIGNAVAEVRADDEEDYSEEEYEDDDGYEDDQEESNAPFGLVGLLTRAMDQEESEHTQTANGEELSDQSERHHQPDLINVVRGAAGLTKNLFSPRRDEYIDDEYEDDVNHEYDEDAQNQVHPEAITHTEPLQTPVKAATSDWDDVTFDDVKEKSQVPAVPSSPKVIAPSQPADNHTSETKSPHSVANRRSGQLVHPQNQPNRNGLVREKGSVSPAHHQRSRINFQSSKEDFQQNTTLQLSSSHLNIDLSGDDMVELESETDLNSDPLLGSINTNSPPPLGEMPKLEPIDLTPDLLAPSLTADSVSPPKIDSVPASAENKPVVTHPSSPRVPIRKMSPPTITNHSPIVSSLATNGTHNGYADNQTSADIMNRCKELESDQSRRLDELTRRCTELESQLESERAQYEQERAKFSEDLTIKFHEKQAQLLEASNEDHMNEVNILRGQLEGKLAAVQGQLRQEQEERNEEAKQWEAQQREMQRQLEQRDNQFRQAQAQNESANADNTKKLERARRVAEDKLVDTLAKLDDRDNQVDKLKKEIKTLKASVNEQHKGVREAEEEADELIHENETLHSQVEKLQSECELLRTKVSELQEDTESLTKLKLEVRMLKEDRDRERARVQSATESSSATSAQLESLRDSLTAEVQDLKQQLTAAHVDLDIAKADTERIMTANNNLQHALEAFQSEKEVELSMIEEQRVSTEEAIAAAHAATLEATHEAHAAELRQAEARTEDSRQEHLLQIKKLEEKCEKYRNESVQDRRSLDEAVQRLQMTADDVVDRSVMRNILLDWLSKPEAKERKQVLEVMASLLQFTEEEKEKVHLGDAARTLDRVVHTVAAPLPPSKADVEKLEGENVREKWVSFLLAETED